MDRIDLDNLFSMADVSKTKGHMFIMRRKCFRGGLRKDYFTQRVNTTSTSYLSNKGYFIKKDHITFEIVDLLRQAGVFDCSRFVTLL
eukprot:g20861.t1